MPIHLPAIFALTGALAAQTTWIVDAGGGGSFVDLPPAVAAAQPGDLILVRAGVYSPVTVSKGLRIVGDPGATLWSLSSPLVVVDRLPAGETFVLQGIDATTSGGPGGVRVLDCAGHVHLERVSMSPVVVERSAQVSLHGLDLFAGAPPVSITDSNAVLGGCRLRASFSVGTLQHALVMERSLVVFAESTAIGGVDFTGIGSGSGIELRSGRLVVAGDAATVVEAGDSRSLRRPTPAIRTLGGAIVLDPAVTLLPKFGGPPIGGVATVATRTVPSVRASVAGGRLSATARANPGDALHLLLGLPLQPVLSLPFGDLWLGPINLVLVSATLPATGSQSVSLPLPPLPAGTVATLQAVVLTAGSVQVSTPAVATLDG
ncbi:MAG: hypothetical protein IPM29_12925 [Planctomycetes bacterium]|nr:hypothetical protein [Planctomycetota bacterium]